MRGRLLLTNIIVTFYILVLAQLQALESKKDIFLNISKANKKQNVLNNETQTAVEEKTKKKKQYLILNQLLKTYALENTVNSLCKSHTEKFKTDARAMEPWALKMLDSSSKLQSGLLLGNLVDLGSYLQCLRIETKTEHGSILGKHCLIKITPSYDLTLKILKTNNLEGQKKFLGNGTFQFGWSVCVPHSCPTDEIERHFNKTIKEITGVVELEVSLDNHHCRSKMTYPELGPFQYFALAFLGLFILMGIIASMINTKKEKPASLIHFIEIFSAKNHIYQIFKLHSVGEYDFIYGLKFLCSCCVVAGHRFAFFMSFPVINWMDEFEWPTQYSSLLVIGSTLSVDIFFMISGMLVSLGFFKSVTKSGNFNVLFFYLYRYLRITLPLAIILLFTVTLAQFLADGPYAYDNYVVNQKPCEYYWWSVLLHLQTIVNPGYLCLFPLWYVSCEMIFYFFSPVILYPLWKWPKLGYASATGIYLCFIGITFHLAWINNYDGRPLPLTKNLLFIDFFKYFYIAPHVRAPSYIIGLVFGYFIFVNKDRTIKLSSLVRYVGWAISFAVLILSIFGCHKFYLDTYKYNKLEATSYLTFVRPCWNFMVLWSIWCCIKGYGGIMDKFLSSYIFKILGKLTYGIFLLHPFVQLSIGASTKVPTTFTNFNALHASLGDITMSIILGLLFTIFYEIPLSRLQAFIFSIKFRDRKKINSE